MPRYFHFLLLYIYRKKNGVLFMRKDPFRILEKNPKQIAFFRLKDTDIKNLALDVSIAWAMLSS